MAAEFKVDYENLTLECSTDKLTTKYHVVKENSGYAFFVFRTPKGSVPAELSGRYTTLEKAKEAFSQYEAGLQKSKTVKRQEFAEAREKRIAESNAESS